MSKNQAKDLFQLQTELIDMKVEIAVSKSIERVVQLITDLKLEMREEIHGLRNDMDKQFATLGNRVTAVESSVAYLKEQHFNESTNMKHYVSKALWAMFAGSLVFVLSNALVVWLK